jgi:hypothetical protein
MSPKEIDAVMSAGSGAHWDPQIVESFMACRSEVYGIGRHTAETPLAAIIGRAVESWNMDSSGRQPAGNRSEGIVRQ